MLVPAAVESFFFFNDTATTEIYTLSLHDALPICRTTLLPGRTVVPARAGLFRALRSEEHTSELQSPPDLVCRLLLEKKKIMQLVAMLVIMNEQMMTMRGGSEEE